MKEQILEAGPHARLLPRFSEIEDRPAATVKYRWTAWPFQIALLLLEAEHLDHVAIDGQNPALVVLRSARIVARVPDRRVQHWC